MARYHGPKQRLQRRVGEDLALKTNPLKTAKRINIHPGQHGQKRARRSSEYGIQLLAKQRVKYIYGVLEKQLHKLFLLSKKDPQGAGQALLVNLERRLDNVVYRAGFAPTRAAARQLVVHGHIQVNNKKLSIPSYLVKANDLIAIGKKAIDIPAIAQVANDESFAVPAWMERKQHLVKVARLPAREEIAEKIEEQLIVEYYSR
ncbi:MAG TPA: 30S ribosomal protein S4 [Candidatus Woesebacteria bacterium]|nr:30S ribosomal protein S4 [Candidatus Woesebacteria bacterium]